MLESVPQCDMHTAVMVVTGSNLTHSTKRFQANFIQIFCFCQSKCHLQKVFNADRPTSVREALINKIFTRALTMNANNNHFIIEVLFLLSEFSEVYSDHFWAMLGTNQDKSLIITHQL